MVAPARNRLEVLTVDAIVEGVHFDRTFTPPAAVGHRALAVNLSDLAAMGAEPRLALLSFALPADYACADFESLVTALAALAGQHGVHIAGGNLTRSPGPLMIDVTLVGAVKPRQALTRTGARPGDEIYVSGSIGAAAAGLEMLRMPGPAYTERRADLSSPPVDPCTARYLFPEPRVRLGLALGRNRAATACVDLSDGLGDGVRRIAEASAVGAVIEAEAVPVEPGAATWFGELGKESVAAAMSGGDDYELLFTVRPRLRGRLAAARQIGNGRASGIEGPVPGGYTHFR